MVDAADKPDAREPDESEPDKSAVLACYAEGVVAIRALGARISDWEAPTPCGDWTAVDLAGHLLAIVRYYHRLLDAVAGGRPLVGLPRGADLAAMNANDLAELEVSGGSERVVIFSELAEQHLQRLWDVEWDATLGTWSGLGDLTVGQHTGVAIGEWHVHAWDLARASGGDHRPNDALTVKKGQRPVRRVVDLAGEGEGEGEGGEGGVSNSWISVLRAYGRDPEWRPPAFT